MVAGQLGKVLGHLRGALVDPGATGPSDGELLSRCARHQDSAAFEVLVRRHGPMVMGVCRRVLRNTHDAEDAFQATFLVLLRKAATLRSPGTVGNWLYGVAYRTALEARRAAARRRAKEAKMVPRTEAPAGAWDELRAVLDQELERLPEKYRAVIVLCDLEGKTRGVAARQLGWPEGTVASRLATARRRLAKRLARYGPPLSGAALAALLSQNASASVPAAVLAGTLRAAGAAPAPVAALADGVMKMMLLTRLKVGLALLLVLSMAGGGLAFLRPGPPAAGPEEAPQGRATGAVAREGTDLYGDPLPAGAVARLGTVRLRHSGAVWALAFSPDGKQVVSGGNDGTARLWDTTTGKELRRFTGKGGYVKSVAFTADGKALITGGTDSIHVRDTATGAEAPLPAGRAGARAGYCIALAADGKTLVAANHGVIEVWDMARREKLRTIEGPASAVEGLAVSPDGKLIATAGPDKNKDIRLWEAATGKALHVLKGHTGDVCALAFSPDGKTLASGSQDKTVRLWDVAAGKEARQLQGHQFWVECLAFSPDGKLLATGSRDSTVRLWDTATGKEARRPLPHHNPVCALAFSPDGKTLATAGFESRVRLWDVAMGQPRSTPGAQGDAVSCAAFLPDGRTIISLGFERIYLWDAATGRERRSFAGPPSIVDGFALSPDGTTAALGDVEGVIRLFSVATGRETRRLEGHKSAVFGLAFAPDGKMLVSAGPDDTIRLWNVASGKEARQFHQDGQRFPQRVAFSPDGKTLATGASDGGSDQTLRLWDVASGKLRHAIHLGPAGLIGLAFSPDGATLVTVGGLPTPQTPGEVRLWDVASGKQLRRLEGHPTQVLGVALSPDGRTLVTGGADRTIRFWEVATGKLRRQLRGHAGMVYGLAFAPDGRRLVSTSEDTTGLVWDVTGHLRGGRLERPRLSPQELDARWADLADDDAVKAYRAVWDLAVVEGAVDFLRDRLKPAAVADAKQIERWVGELDSESYEARTSATSELEKLGDAAGPALRKVLAGSPSAETQRRAGQLLEKLASHSGERLRVVRAVEALEHAASAEARKLLTDLAAGAPRALQTPEAQAALRRLDR